MTSRSRFSKSHDWDPMQEDYNDNSYNPQYPDDEINGNVQLDHCKLYVKNISKALNADGLKAVFEKYATNVKVFLSNNPLKRFAIVSFDSPGEAKLAMMKLNRTEPLKLIISIAHMSKNQESQNQTHYSRPTSQRDRSESSSSKGWNNRKQEEQIEDDGIDETLDDEDLDLQGFDTESELEQVNLKLKYLELKAEQIKCKQRIILLNKAGKKTVHKPPNNRCILPDGRIVVKNDGDRLSDNAFSSAGGDSITTSCSCDRVGNEPAIPNAAKPTGDTKDKFRYAESVNTTYDTLTEVTKTVDDVMNVSDTFDNDSGNDIDETSRLIELRNVDYSDVVDDRLRIVIALSGYPKIKMHLKHMELFQKCLNNIMDMQLKAGLLKKTPSFFDYYINRGAIVCICKDMDSRDWMVRVNPGLQERMDCKLMLLKAKIKRLCLALMKIPKSCWPSTVEDAFKLLQYFNPALKTDLWKIYAKKIIDGVEHTYFTIDRVSGEIIRGPNFKNVIDYKQMDFEINAFTEIYYDCYISDMEEDLSSVASRVKLLNELKSTDNTPRNISDDSAGTEETCKFIKDEEFSEKIDKNEETFQIEEVNDVVEILDATVTKDVDLENIPDHFASDVDVSDVDKDMETDVCDTSVSCIAPSEQSELETVDRNSNLNIDSNRGVAYHRRTNYLHVENELKIAIVLEGYPQEKLDGSHIRRLRHLFKDSLHKDMKMQRFSNLIIPKFQDTYLSNGAVIYVCDSLETMDYLRELLPKFIHSTGLQLTFRDINNLIRYTRVIMKVPKEFADFKSEDILIYFQDRFPNLRLDCWKVYSDVVGKQKRQFGVDPESLEVLKSEEFDAVYEGEEIEFRIINRKKSVEESVTNNIEEDNDEVKLLKENILKTMYSPISPGIMNISLTRIRANHYSDLVDDDLKLYIGPINYPETRIDEKLFNSVKKSIENIVFDTCVDNLESIPIIHDLYLFDGVIFIICQNIISRIWIENNIDNINGSLKISLKATEFRGAVGIVSMVARTSKNTEEVINVLQEQNPRLRTKFWRKISKVQTRSKLDVVMQIDKLSAQVISSKDFNSVVDGNNVEFKLGHLQSLLKTKTDLKEPNKTEEKVTEIPKQKDNITVLTEKVDFSENIERNTDPNTVFDKENDLTYSKLSDNQLKSNDSITSLLNTDNKSDKSSIKIETDDKNDYCKVIMKVPTNILQDFNDGLEIVLDLLEDKNPGLNTELWKVECRSPYHRGKFTMLIDRQSEAVIKSPNFDPMLGDNKLKFLF